MQNPNNEEQQRYNELQILFKQLEKEAKKKNIKLQEELQEALAQLQQINEALNQLNKIAQNPIFHNMLNNDTFKANLSKQLTDISQTYHNLKAKIDNPAHKSDTTQRTNTLYNSLSSSIQQARLALNSAMEYINSVNSKENRKAAYNKFNDKRQAFMQVASHFVNNFISTINKVNTPKKPSKPDSKNNHELAAWDFKIEQLTFKEETHNSPVAEKQHAFFSAESPKENTVKFELSDGHTLEVQEDYFDKKHGLTKLHLEEALAKYAFGKAGHTIDKSQYEEVWHVTREGNHYREEEGEYRREWVENKTYISPNTDPHAKTYQGDNPEKFYNDNLSKIQQKHGRTTSYYNDHNHDDPDAEERERNYLNPWGPH